MMVSFATALVAVSAVLCLGGVPATGIRGDHRSSGGTLKVRSRRSHTSSAAAAVPANACVICGTQSTKSKPTINSLTFKWTGANDALATLGTRRAAPPVAPHTRSTNGYAASLPLPRPWARRRTRAAAQWRRRGGRVAALSA